MKITSASKKVLASALSAAMVVAFAPTVAFAATTELTEADYIAAGAKAKVLEGTAGEMNLGTTGVKYYDTLQGALNAVGTYLDTNGKTGATVTLLAEPEATADGSGFSITGLDGDDTLNINMNGFGITATKDGAVALAVSTAATGANTINIKNGSLKAGKGAKAFQGGSYDYYNLENMTVESDISAKVETVKGGTYKAIEDLSGDLTINGGKFSSSSDTAGVSTIKTSGAVTLKGEVEIEAASSAASGDATGIETTVANSTLSVDKKAAVSVKAVSADGTATAVLAEAKDIPTGTYYAMGKDADHSFAFNTMNATVGATLAISGGTFTGKAGYTQTGAFAPYANTQVTGGTFSVKPTVGTDYGLIDEDPMWTVYKKAVTFGTVAGSSNATHALAFPGAGTNEAIVMKAVADAVDIIVAGGTAANFVPAEGKTAADVKAAVKKGGVKAEVIFKNYNANVATDAEKANYAALEELAKKNRSVINTANTYKVFTLAIEVTNGKTGSDRVVLGTMSDFGTDTRGAIALETQAAYKTTKSDVAANAFTFAVANNGTATTVATKEASNRTDILPVIAAPGMYAAYSLSLAAVDEEKPEAPAVEKATQGIDVSQKSRTVKLAKGKTKTQKALYFKMGASAETELATAKKSGSSRITVSGDKVTLKKGTKKGTYTAKVSLKAAGSDEYLAAAKTITVKFVVKK